MKIHIEIDTNASVGEVLNAIAEHVHYNSITLLKPTETLLLSAPRPSEVLNQRVSQKRRGRPPKQKIQINKKNSKVEKQDNGLIYTKGKYNVPKIDIPATLNKFGLTEKELMQGNYRVGSPQARLKQAIIATRDASRRVAARRRKNLS